MIKNLKWTDERNIYILAGIEIFIKRDLGKWYIKTERCNKCGECCRKVKCEHLIFKANEWLCDYGVDRPFQCCIYEGTEEYCSVRWRKTNIAYILFVMFSKWVLGAG